MKPHTISGSPEKFSAISFREAPNQALTWVSKNTLAEEFYSGYYFARNPQSATLKESHQMNIGQTIKSYRLQKGMSQGDIEKRTGLLRCYLSRVENGHTIPSLDTLAKIASAMDLPLAQFFADQGSESSNGKNLPQWTEDEVRFLTQFRRYSNNLNDSDRKLVMAMVKKLATGVGK